MTIFEPLFLLLVLAAVAAIARAAIAVARHQWPRAGRILVRSSVAGGAYAMVVLGVALASPRRVYRVGDNQCFDDWCIAVMRATHTEIGGRLFYDVTLRLTSRAIRVTQRERSAIVYLEDATHRRFDPVPANDAAPGVPLDVALGPGESAIAMRRFALPADATDPGLVFAHSGFPIGAFIVGENFLFHGPPIVRPLEQRGARASS